ncbi:Cell division protein FtsZ [Candidatus Deianiraea vastatrix]|uniref:Cell division protein FtsZ n=1 Tax=Candidatus Deianiraea vastatrix TaxID=2163644 RepID=A0A5B8XFM5_9RICK|nr:cell division protein FtsZ [Candidatus Deianiraea vastatrix]QED23715.1 Cell division protein FtsZ [Candidatus Deianiraea vastatrix]
MSISLDSVASVSKQQNFKPRLVIFGVGGAGGNAINNMIRSGLDGVEFFAINTDAQALEYSLAETKVQIGKDVTGGLGAGALPETGRSAAMESEDSIRGILEGTHMLFITAGMGGGTGTGAAPAIAEIAKSMGILTIGVVTKPFDFEGKSRQRVAESGIDALRKHVDTLIVIPNQNLFRVVNERTSFVDAFKIADEVLYSGVKCITDLITMPGLVNLDFADVKTVMKNMGRAMMSSGESTGEDRSVKAAESAIINPLLDISSVNGARGVLINITGGSDMTLFEVNDAVETIRNNLDDSANIIFGAIFNEQYDGIIRVSVVATGVGDEDDDIIESSSGKKAEEDVSKRNVVKKEVKVAGSRRAMEIEDEAEIEDARVMDDEEDELDDDFMDDVERDFDANEEELIETKSQKAASSEIIEDDEYLFGQISEPQREVMLKKVKRDYDKEINGVAGDEEAASSEGGLSKKKFGFSGVINNILFGSGDDEKKKVSKTRTSIAEKDFFDGNLFNEEKNSIEYIAKKVF